MELLAGLEPATYWLRISCSTDWATIAYTFRPLKLYHSAPPPSTPFPAFLADIHAALILLFVFLQVSLHKNFGIFDILTPDHSVFSIFFLPAPTRIFAFLHDSRRAFCDFHQIPHIFYHYFKLHNFFNNRLLQVVIHIFHRLFNIRFFLVFQSFSLFFTFFGIPCNRVFTKLKKPHLIYIILWPFLFSLFPPVFLLFFFWT